MESRKGERIKSSDKDIEATRMAEKAVIKGEKMVLYRFKPGRPSNYKRYLYSHAWSGGCHC
jgi:hypothetical protein